MAVRINIDNLGAVGRQAVALGNQAKPAIRSALLKGAKVITQESKLRAPRSAKHRGGHGRSSRHLADVLKADSVSGRNTSGVMVEGGANGPSFYWKFVEHGTRKMDARKFVAKSAEAKEDEVLEVVAEELKNRLGF